MNTHHADNKMWYVIQFAGTDETEAIPDFWLRFGGKKAVWSPYSSATKIVKANVGRHQPDVSWVLYDVSRIFDNSGTFSKLLLFFPVRCCK